VAEDGGRRPRQALSTVHGGAIIVRKSREKRAAWSGMQGVISDLLLLHGDEIEPPGRDVVDGRQRPLVRRHI